MPPSPHTRADVDYNVILVFSLALVCLIFKSEIVYLRVSGVNVII